MSTDSPGPPAVWSLQAGMCQESPKRALPPYRELETAVGPLFLPAEDRVMAHIIGEHGRWEPCESAVLAALIRPGGCVVDVGAHVGYMTLLAAKHTGESGHVLAVEANPANFELLCANLRRHAAVNVRAVRAAAWRRSAEKLTMTISPDNSGDHRVFRREETSDTVEVDAFALDDLIPDHWSVGIVKIDVQGTDHVAVAGMTRTIERCRPTILVEFWPIGIEEFGDDPASVLALYGDLGYRIAILDEPAVDEGTAPEEIVDIARGCKDEYCTLLLHPDVEQKQPTGSRVESLLARGPARGPHSVLGPFGPAVRKVVLRAMKPYTAYQRMVDDQFLDELRQLSGRLQAVERAIHRRRT